MVSFKNVPMETVMNFIMGQVLYTSDYHQGQNTGPDKIFIGGAWGASPQSGLFCVDDVLLDTWTNVSLGSQATYHWYFQEAFQITVRGDELSIGKGLFCDNCWQRDTNKGLFCCRFSEFSGYHRSDSPATGGPEADYITAGYYNVYEGGLYCSDDLLTDSGDRVGSSRT